jgi:thioesterase domain-containing protein
MTREDTLWAGNVVQELAQAIRNQGEQVRYVLAVMRDSMLTPEESKARWDAIAECEAQDG